MPSFSNVNLLARSSCSCSANHHVSSNTPNEQEHLSVTVASETSWNAGYGRGSLHVYSIGGDTFNGYHSWRRTDNASKDKFKGDKVKKHLTQALANDLTQAQAEWD